MSAPKTPIEALASAEASTSLPLPSVAAKLPELATRKEYLVDPSLIDVIEGHNPRYDFGDIDSLAAQIEVQYLEDEVGVLVPLVIRRSLTKPGRFDLISGERRLRAVSQLIVNKGLTFTKGIPAKLMSKDATTVDMLVRDLISNTGKPLLALEEAQAFARLRDEHHMTLEAIGKAVGRSHMHVFSALKLLTADPDVLAAVKDGTISATVAKEMAVKVGSDPAAQREMVASVRAAGKDKKKLKAAKKSIKTKTRAVQEKRATARGRTLKMRALTDADLGVLGSKVAGYLATLMKDAGIVDAESFMVAVSSDNKLAAAYTLGALHGLRNAAGEKINLKL